MQPPSEALVADAERLSAPDVLRLLPAVEIAQVLWRGSKLTLADARAVLGPMLRPVLSARPVSQEPGPLTNAASAAATALLTYSSARGGADAIGAAADQAATAVQGMVAELERDGAFVLAASALAALRATVPEIGLRTEALVLAQEGRIARQRGQMVEAEARYRRALSLARRSEAPDAAARALLGLGVAASMRGNYPQARVRFRRAISAAGQADDANLTRMAHQGLLSAALAAGDIDTALRHGWAAAELAPTAEDRAEAMVNLAEVCRAAHQLRAALRGYLVALDLSTLPRICLSALGGGVLVAAELGQDRLLHMMASAAERLTRSSGQPYENAITLVEIAEAFAVRKDAVAVAKYSALAAAAVSGHPYHEVTYRLERLAFGLTVSEGPQTTPRSSADPHQVLSGSSVVLNASSREILERVESLATGPESVWAEAHGRTG